MIFSASEDYFQNRVAKWLERSFQHDKIAELQCPHTALGTDIGILRKENQDRVIFLRAHLGQPVKQAFVAAILCDGMGGMTQGGACADISLSTFLTWLIRSKEDDFNKRLEIAAFKANDAVYRKFVGEGGATLSAFIIDENMGIYAINVGDSRIYEVTSEGDIDQVSIDDTIEAQLLAINRTPNHQTSMSNQLVQYIGMGEGLMPHHIQFHSKDKLRSIILTSDGAHNINRYTFKSIVINAKSPKEIVERLLSISKWCGGNDNATVICLFLNDPLGISIQNDAPTNLVELWNPFAKVEFWPFFKYQKLASITQKQEQILPGNEELIKGKSRGKRRIKRDKLQSPANERGKAADNDAGNDKAKQKDKKNGPTLNIIFPQED
jgi:serine/threonine protein phosphatase PrpC